MVVRLSHSRRSGRDSALYEMRRLDLTGEIFGELTVLRFASSDRKKSSWICRCSCGNTVTKVGADLKKGQRFCTHGCPEARKLLSVQRTTHGMSRHPAFAVWRSMLARCFNPKHQAFKNYGGRGIGVCVEWTRSFEAFWADMGPTYVSGLDIDREDNDSEYSPNNCRWATRRVNSLNRRGNVATAELLDAAKAAGISRSTLYYRLRRKVSAEQLLETPDTTRTFPLTRDSKFG